MGHHLGWALAGYGNAVPGPRRPFHENLRILIDAAGSGRAAGRLLGVAETTLRRWRSGVTPRHDRQSLVISAGRAILGGTTYRRAYEGELTIRIKGVIVASKDVRDRTISPGRTIPRRSFQRTLRLWLAGDDEAAGNSLLKATEKYYEGLSVDFIESAWFE